jgi:hypothetical protein
MPLQFTTIEEPSFSRGIDARSAENQIRDGFVRDLVNADIVEGRVKKRKGYAPFAGNIPLRVIGYRQPEIGKAIVSLDGSIDLSRVTPGPILIYGRTSASHSSPNPFTSSEDRAWWFTNWETNLRKIFNASTTASITATPAEHSIPTTDMYVGVSENTDVATDTLTGELLTTSVTVESDRTIRVDYTNGRLTDVPVFLYYLDRTPTAGESYSQSFTTTLATESFSVPASTHELATSNIIYQLYQQVGGNWVQSKPDAFSCSAVGDTTFTVTATVGSVFRIILSSVPDSQAVEAGSTVILTAMPNSYLFYTCYDGVNEIIPDTVIFNDTTKDVTFTFSGEEVPESIRVCYAQGIIRTNEIYLDDADIAAGTATFSGLFSSTFADTVPQLTLYGISHGIAYGDEKRQYRRGWVNHVDSYRSPSTSHVVAGLGGNLFSARTPNELVDAQGNLLNSSIAMPTYYPDLFTRVNAETWVGPAFIDSSATPTRSRGTYSFVGGGDGLATVTAVEYNPSTGYTEYTLATPGRVKTGTPIDATDYLTVQGMSSTKHQGTFKIVTIDETNPTELVLAVENGNLDSTDYNDLNTSGYAGVFTDSFIFKPTLTNPFLPGDRLLASSWGDETTFLITESNDTATTRVYFGGCISLTKLGTSLAITGRRTSDTIPLRTVNRNPSVDFLIPGDTLSFSEIDDPLQIVAVDADNKTVTVDRSITWADTIALPATFSVAARWIPVEAPRPDASDVLISANTVRYFTASDYDNQSFLRSAMVQNNLYLTNGNDEVYKYDGEHNYRAGIIPWQPGLFLTVENVASGGVPLAGDSFSVTGGSIFAGKSIVVPKADAALLNVNDLVRVVFSNSATAQSAALYLTLASIVAETSGTDSTISFKEPVSISFTPDTIEVTLVYTARYSFRLNIKDVNGVTTASAVTGAEDFIAQLVPTTAQQQQVRIKLVGMPVWDKYDYSNRNIELEVYRTFWSTQSAGEVPVFYKVATRALTFLQYNGYIEFIDRYSNDSLTQEDSVVSVLSPSTVPAGWDEPPRAKYTTTAGNRLVLANLIDWPTMSLTFTTPQSVAASEFVGQKFLFRRDNTDSLSTTDNVNRITYELVSSSTSETIHPETSGSSGQFRFTATTPLPAGVGAGSWVYLHYDVAAPGVILSFSAAASSETFTTTTPHGLAVNDLVHFEGPAASLPGGIVSGKGYYVESVPTSSKFTIKETYTGGVFNITSDGSGTVSSAKANPEYCGWWQVFSIAGSTITVKDVNSNITVTPTHFPNRAAFATSTLDVPVLVDVDGNMGMANGNGPVPYLNIIRRLGMAINATMRLTTAANFVPWLVARSESDTVGQLIVKQPRAETVLPSVESTWVGTKTYTTYVNGSQIASGAKTDAAITSYPSRLAVSYDNYPEIFDSLWVVNTDESDSVIDVNSADGQEITGVIPFFGESAFGASQKAGVLVVFKQNSIYLVNVAAKVAGQEAVQRLETQGLGCTAPYSIAPTKNGIMFANESGIYALRTDQRIEYLGRFMERNWQEKVDLGALSIAQGHHYGVGRQYKLSVPMVAESSSTYAENSQVYVYNHTAEADGELGGWTRYTNHPVTGWANLFQDAFLATANGSVMKVRNLGGVTDYRDQNSPIESILAARANAFGNTGIRKAVANLVVHYRSGANSEYTKVYTSPDLFDVYQESELFKVVTKSVQDGLSTTSGQAIVSIMHTFPRRRCIYMSVTITNNGIDDNVEIAGMSYIVAGLSSSGIKQAAETTE